MKQTQTGPANQNTKKKRVLLAFSGGLDTSAIVPWLMEAHNAEVIAYCSDLGNAPDEVALKAWAKELGASQFIFEDLKEEFAKRFVFPAIQAGATYQDDYYLGTSLGRPLIAERMAYFAKNLGADAIAHGCTGKGNDQIRFERSWAYLVPGVEVIAPWRTWSFKGRGDLLAYLKSKGFDLPAKEKVYSEDVNLMHRSCEGGVLENPGTEYDPENIYKWVKAPNQLGRDSISVEIGFESGIPKSVNGTKLGAFELLSRLNDIAGHQGVGVQDLVEERANGIKSRGVYETPGGTLLHLSLKALKHLCWDRSLLGTARALGVQYGEAVYDGFWHTDLARSIEAFFGKASETLTGSVTLKLQAGTARVAKRSSPYSLYDSEAVTFEADQTGIHHLADGWCKISSIGQIQKGRRDAKAGRTVPQ